MSDNLKTILIIVVAVLVLGTIFRPSGKDKSPVEKKAVKKKSVKTENDVFTNIKKLKSADRKDRLQAAKELGKSKFPAAAAALYEASMYESDDEVRQAIFESMDAVAARTPMTDNQKMMQKLIEEDQRDLGVGYGDY